MIIDANVHISPYNTEFGRTGWNVSEISFGAWAIGGTWGDVPEDDAMAALNEAIDQGVNFIDTADVYGDGRMGSKSHRRHADLRGFHGLACECGG